MRLGHSEKGRKGVYGLGSLWRIVWCMVIGVTNVLSIVIILELIRAFVDYFEHERVRMEILIEIAVAFMVREFMIYIFAGNLKGVDVLLWILGIFLLVGARTLTVVFKPTK